MQDKISASVVIVNYNSGEYLRRCLESLTLSDAVLEIVLVDNASQDNSCVCVETLEPGNHEIKLLCNHANVGFATAVNSGVAQTSSDVVVLLNPDSVVHPDSIRVLTEALNDNGNVAIAGGLVFNADGTEQNGCRRREPDLARSALKSVPLLRFILGNNRKGSLDMSREPLPSIPIPVDAVSGSFMGIRRSVFEDMDGMDTDYFLHCEDLDICRVIRDKGYRVLFVPKATVFHQQGGSSGAYPFRVEWYKRNGMLRYFNKHQASGFKAWQRILVHILVTVHFFRTCIVLIVKRLTMRSKDKASQTMPDQQQLPDATKTILITGASSIVGTKLISRLINENFSVIAMSRSKKATSDRKRLRWFNVEYLDKVSEGNFPPIHTMIHLAPIWVLPKLLPQLSRLNINRIIATSSTSLMAKKSGTDKQERDVTSRLARAEDAAWEYASKNDIALTILRATMIYDGVNDKNISKLVRFIKRFGFFLLAGGGGLRQPVHVNDVVAACVRSMNSPSAIGQTYVISGGSVLSYKDMVNELFRGLDKKPNFISVPIGFMRFAMSFIAKIAPGKNLSPAMIDRMQSDLCYSYEKAKTDFAYAPQIFSINN